MIPDLGSRRVCRGFVLWPVWDDSAGWPGIRVMTTVGMASKASNFFATSTTWRHLTTVKSMQRHKTRPPQLQLLQLRGEAFLINAETCTLMSCTRQRCWKKKEFSIVTATAVGHSWTPIRHQKREAKHTPIIHTNLSCISTQSSTWNLREVFDSRVQGMFA